MKLDQLLQEETHDAYINRLVRTLKIRKIGEGSYAEVYQHPVYHNVAVKVLYEPDPMYLKYLRMCENYPSNPWLPNVVGVHKVMYHPYGIPNKDIRHDVYNDRMTEVNFIIFFEKLKEPSRREFDVGLRKLFSTINHPAVKKLIKQADKEGEMLSPNNIPNSTWFSLVKSHDRNIAQLGQILKTFQALDIHDGNIMARDDGQLVFTDPVAS